ncbi:MAG: ABC transporter permease [Xanthobacteraceae bacterium]|nr:ABC transporter permease [Xanthobacteraceae bacterium]
MILTAAPASPPNLLALTFRFALRELRGGLRGFYVFIACIALGVMAIAGVGATSSSLSDGLAHQARILLGGDVTFALFQREATAEELQFLKAQGRFSAVATSRGMARNGNGDLALIDIKAVDGMHPLLGHVDLDPQLPLGRLLAPQNGVYGAAVDPVLLARLNLKVGDRVTVGSATFEIRSTVTSEPDKLLGGISFGPRFLMSIDALRSSGLLQPGSLIRWTYRVALDHPSDAAVRRLTDTADARFPQAGWEIRSSLKASPQLERSVSRFTQYLTLVGLAALLIGGVGVVNAVRSHLERRRDVIATYKALGAPSRVVFAIYLMQVLLLAVAGSLIGTALGAALPYAILLAFKSILPLPLEPAIHLPQLALSLAYGVLAALAFALWPLGRVDDVSVAALFRDEVTARKHAPSRAYIALTGLALLVLVGVAVGFAYDRKVALIFVAASAFAFVLLRGVATLVMATAKRLPRTRITMLRLAIANIHRPGALTPSVVLSLGLGLATLVTVTQIDGNLRRQFGTALPEHAPSFYFLDVPSGDAPRFEQLLKDTAPGASIETVPMLRGRIIAIKGIEADKLKPSADVEWVLQSDRGLTYSNEVPKGSKIIEGTWWRPDHQGKPLVSMEKKIADGFGLKVGDDITVNVLGRNITATVGNLRQVDWQTLGINFVLVFSPNAFQGAPHTDIATLTTTQQTSAADAAIIKTVAAAFPSITSIRVRDALQSIGAVINNLVLGIRGASLLTLVSALLVLGGALAAGHRHRVYDAVILKTLGATRWQLLGAYVTEYLLIALATAIFGVAAGSIAAWQIVTRLMTLSFQWQAGYAGIVVVAAVILTVCLGLAGTLLALNQKPAAVLRNL